MNRQVFMSGPMKSNRVCIGQTWKRLRGKEVIIITDTSSFYYGDDCWQAKYADDGSTAGVWTGNHLRTYYKKTS